MNKAQYYTNRLEYPGTCPQIPTRPTNFLDKNNCLSEFITPTDKEAARANLGIPDIILNLNLKIDAKVIERGGVAWDIQPTEGDTEKVLSSHALYNTFLKYTLRTELDNRILQVWSDTINKISENYNRIESEINELNADLRECIDDVRCSFNDYTTHINQLFTEFKNQVLQLYDLMQSSVELLLNFVNEKVEEMLTFVNTKVDELTTEVNNLVRELTNNVSTAVENLNNFINELVSQMRTEMRELKVDVQNTLNEFLRTKYVPLESRMKSIELLMETFLLSVAGGTALTDLFGSDEYIGVNLKTLTSAINKLWDKIEEITGETTQGINMVVSPTYFIGEDGCTVNISASSSEANGIFEHIAFYSDGNLIAEADNVDLFNTQTHINDTTEIKCVAKIMGVEYTKTKTITHYNSFFLLSGSFESEESAVEYAMNHPEYSRPVTSGLRGAYNITCNLDDNIIVIFGSAFASAFLRADLNSIEIPFEHKTVTIDNKEYVVFISTNKYNAGDYNIDING